MRHLFHHWRHGPRADMHPRGPRGPFGPGGPFGRGGPFGHGQRGPGGDEPFFEGGGRQRRGDIKFLLLELLAEQPRHGYDLIKAIEERSGGFYRPSPGSIYPTLQLLEDGGQIVGELIEGKRVFTITEAGRALLAEQRPDDRPHRPGRHEQPPEQLHALRQSMQALATTAIQIAQQGTPEQAGRAAALIDETRRALHRILAGEP